MSGKKKRAALSVEVKSKLIKTVEDNPTKKKTDIAKEFGIPPTTLFTILKNKDKFEEGTVFCAKAKRLKSCELKDVDECVLSFLL